MLDMKHHNEEQYANEQQSFNIRPGAKSRHKSRLSNISRSSFSDGDNMNSAEDNEEEGLEVVPELRKLDYSIEMERSKTTLGNLFDSPMAPTESAVPDSVKGHKTQTKKQLLSSSIAECASRRQPSVTEDGST